MSFFFFALPMLAVHERGLRELLRGFWVRHLGVWPRSRPEPLQHETGIYHPLATCDGGFSLVNVEPSGILGIKTLKGCFLGQGTNSWGTQPGARVTKEWRYSKRRAIAGGRGPGEDVLRVCALNLPSSFSHTLLDLGTIQNLLFWLHSFHQLKCSWQPDPCG